jgi:hypothetical protein
MNRLIVWLIPAVLLCSCAPTPGESLHPRAEATLPAFNEVEWTWTDSAAAARICLNLPLTEDIQVPRSIMLILYALPNGNTIEQTKGRKAREGLDWHFDIQHIAAQTKFLRRTLSDRPIAIAYLEAAGLSWPRWRREHVREGEIIVRVVDSLRVLAGGSDVRVVLTGHSGGGSFTFGYLNASDSIPPFVERIGFLDSNYGFSDSAGHTAKLLGWLRGDTSRVLSVIAYDDREIVLDGKKVVGPDGGTYRRSLDMVRCLGAEVGLDGNRRDSLMVFAGMQGQIELLIHLNSANQILHTRLVGEMNGFLHAMTVKRRDVIPLQGPVVYGEFVE